MICCYVWVGWIIFRRCSEQMVKSLLGSMVLPGINQGNLSRFMSLIRPLPMGKRLGNPDSARSMHGIGTCTTGLRSVKVRIFCRCWVASGSLLNLVESRFRSNCGRGRPRFPLGPILFALACKAYYGLSSRRLHSQLELAARLGYLRGLPPDVFDARSDDAFNLPDEAVDSPIPRFNTVCYYLRADWMTPVLLELVTVSATPVRGLETAFAVDGTGWSTHPFERWLDHRLEVETVRHGWVKLHIISGDLTNVISRAVISPSNHHDNPYFRELVTSTAQHFKMSKVQADMAYSSRVNYDLVRRLGAELYVPFKSNTVPVVDDGSAWSDALQFFNNFPDAFNDEYHQRSNVESTNSALKRKFPAQLRSKAFSGHVNEILCKIIAYNLGVVGREMRMRGVVPDFPKEVYMLENSVKALNEEPRALVA